MTETTDFWSGTFGDGYTERNRVDWPVRVPFWADIVARTRPGTVLEVGCNAGWNLMALRSIGGGPFVRGIDVNQKAIEAAADAGLPASLMSAADVGLLFPDSFDLVFTVGVLIHVPPEELPAVMAAIVQASRRHVLAVEYEADADVEVEYRGHAGRLWRRPFGRLYEGLGLTTVLKMDAGPGFDRCTAWLMEKR